MAASDPMRTFLVSVALRQVSERSGRTTWRLTENYSAKKALDSEIKTGRLMNLKRTLINNISKPSA